MSFDNLLLERDGAVALLCINRPKVLNALNTQTIRDLREAVLELTHDATIRAVILTGAGDRAFVAGADISELRTLGAAQAQEYARHGQQVRSHRGHGEAGDCGSQRLCAWWRL